MSKQFIIEKTKKTPRVFFDTDAGILDIKGYSLPSDAKEFYTPLFVVVEEYLKSPQQQTELNFYIEYFNTSSSKVILQLMKTFSVLKDMGKDIVCNWFVDEEDADMIEAGNEYKSIINFTFNVLPVKE